MSTTYETSNTYEVTSVDNFLLPPPPPQNLTVKYPSSPDFSFMRTDSFYFKSAYAVVCQRESWNLLSNFKEQSFMFSKDPKINELMIAINDAYDGGHSGASLAITMRQLEYIAKNGFSAFKDGWKHN